MENNKLVYGWFDSNELFYVGCGIQEEIFSNSNKNQITRNTRLIAEQWNQFTVKILYNNLSWQRAIEIERQILLCYGRRFNGTGILTNETLGNDSDLSNVQDIQFVPVQKARKSDKTVRTPQRIFESVIDAAQAYEVKPAVIRKLVKDPIQKDWQYLTF